MGRLEYFSRLRSESQRATARVVARAIERRMLLEIAESVEEAAEDFDRDIGLICRVANRLRFEAADLWA